MHLYNGPHGLLGCSLVAVCLRCFQLYIIVCCVPPHQPLLILGIFSWEHSHSGIILSAGRNSFILLGPGARLGPLHRFVTFTHSWSPPLHSREGNFYDDAVLLE